MYEFLVKVMYELDYRKFNITELEQIKDILDSLKGEVLETHLKRIDDKGQSLIYKKEEENVSAMGEEKTDRGSGKSL